MMRKVFIDVRDFHRRGDVPCPSKIGFPESEIVELRKRLNLEEVTETNEALDARDMVGAAKEIIDSIYVLIGNAIALGLSWECFDDIWHEVQLSNLDKFVWNESLNQWTVYKDAGGKVTKPPGWTPPDIRGVLLRHGWDPDADKARVSGP